MCLVWYLVVDSNFTHPIIFSHSIHLSISLSLSLSLDLSRPLRGEAED